MQKSIFLEDLKKVYELIELRTAKINKLYSLVHESDKNGSPLLKKLLKICSLKPVKPNKIAVLNRIAALREDLLILSLDGRADTKEILARVYSEVAAFHIKAHEELLDTIEKQKLLSPFYRTLFGGWHKIGVELTSWQPKWTEYIINTINPKLLKEFGDDAVVARFLGQNDLLDKNRDGTNADRSYSALIEDGEGYKNAAYAVVFADEVRKTAEKIDELIAALQNENDDIFNAKEAYIVYLCALKKAFCEKSVKNLILAWQDADRAWMNIKTPIQPAHPFEYYEDHYKKAVALEWDMRVQNPAAADADKTKKRILNMYETVFKEAEFSLRENALHANASDAKIWVQNRANIARIYEKTCENIAKTDLYISRPMLYYAAQFNGLFSAQVVPNDETVSKKAGKKIFAYADNVLDSIRAKPFMKISSEVFGAKFIKNERELVFKKPEIWHKIYEITTIGHEFGHILWIDDDTENKMNASGVFKNIEEFKATAGGLCAFFKEIDEALLPFVINDTIKRAVSLIAWQKTAEVEPYYCECLIHLSGLFESGVLSFGEKLRIDTGKECVDTLIKWYLQTYLELSCHYLDKKDAKEFLDRFAYKADGFYMPRDKAEGRFVSYYWELHKSIGREIDESDTKENWL
ncbi:MAG: invasion protein CiaB [Campylobacteraceae bacterium]|jgi:hypothetical protein|nr:invasion protein CiaB [Campylobacteraceae bacterium]